MAGTRRNGLSAALWNLERSRDLSWAEAEPLVTAGYAQVLALEAERLAVMRELVRLAASVETAAGAASLTAELDAIGAELSALRSGLCAARRRFGAGAYRTPPATG